MANVLTLQNKHVTQFSSTLCSPPQFNWNIVESCVKTYYP